MSRRLAYLLRHDPAAAGLTLDPAGWVEVPALLAALAAAGQPLTTGDLTAVVAAGPKRRFELAGDRIRAVHGHSVPVDLGLSPATPPPTLFHGTTARALRGIRAVGLTPRGRRFVHLAVDVPRAQEVAARHGRDIVVLAVDTVALTGRGQQFFASSSGVWLTGPVPAVALTELPTGTSIIP